MLCNHTPLPWLGIRTHLLVWSASGLLPALRCSGCLGAALYFTFQLSLWPPKELLPTENSSCLETCLPPTVPVLGLVSLLQASFFPTMASCLTQPEEVPTGKGPQTGRIQGLTAQPKASQEK